MYPKQVDRYYDQSIGCVQFSNVVRVSNGGNESCKEISEMYASTRGDVEQCLKTDQKADEIAKIGNIPHKDSQTSIAPKREGFPKKFLRTEAKIAACAKAFGWNFFYMPDAEQEVLKAFLETHLHPEVMSEYLRKVGKVKATLEREFTKIESFLEAMVEIEKLFSEHTETADNENTAATIKKKRAKIRSKIRAATGLIESLENGDIVAEHISDIFMALQAMWQKYSYDADEFKQLLTKISTLQGLLRYMIEAQEGTYKSGRFSGEYFAKVLGFSDIEELFFRQIIDEKEVLTTRNDRVYQASTDPNEKTRRLIVDLGCGDGDLLVGLAREYRRWVRSGELLGLNLLLSFEDKLILEIPTQDTQDAMQKIIFQIIKDQEFFIKLNPEPIDPKFIGVDQTRSFPAHLRSPEHGICGRRGDICAPFGIFQDQTEIAAGSVDVVTTTLTLDRAYSVNNLFANMAAMLRDDGRFMIATKTLIKTESDGEGAKKHRIHYGTNTLASTTYAGTLSKLARELAKHDLNIETLSCHPCLVSSSDCYPDEIRINEVPHFHFQRNSKTANDVGVVNPKKKYGPQEYQLLVVAGKKRTKK